MVHRANEEGECACEHGSEKHVGCDSAGTIPRKCIDEVVEGCAKDCRETDTSEENSDKRRPVIYLRA